MSDLQPMAIKVTYTYMPVYNQKRLNSFSNLTLFSYGPAVHLISWKIFVSHLHWLRLLAYEITLEWKRLNGVTSHGL